MSLFLAARRVVRGGYWAVAGLAMAVLSTGVGGTGLIPVNPVLNSGFELQASTDGGGGYADGALYWSEGYGSNAQFNDFNADGDREAILAPTSVGMHNFWQSILPPLQAFSANFDRYEFTVESGVLSAATNVQIGFSLTPQQSQHPYGGIFWEGAVFFTASDLLPGSTGRVSVNPVAHGEIICPDWQPCIDFKAAYDSAAGAAQKRTLLGQARIVQVSLWYANYNAPSAVVVDDFAILGATSVAEEIATGNVNPNPCTSCLE